MKSLFLLSQRYAAKQMDMTTKKGDFGILQLKLKISEHTRLSSNQIFAILLRNRVVQLFFCLFFRTLGFE